LNGRRGCNPEPSVLAGTPALQGGEEVRYVVVKDRKVLIVLVRRGS
jgi:hypothetical protein